MSRIHPTAIVDPAAQLGMAVEIGPYAVIGPNVRIGERCSVGAHAVIEGHTTIGADNRIFQFASIGAAPQDKKYRDEPTRLDIGDRNTFREFTTINRGTVQDGGVTRIGDDNWIMAYVHVAHDCQLGNHVTIANDTNLAGHVVIGDWVTLGGFTGVHQFCKIGAHVMTAIASVVVHDIPPYTMVSGNTAQPHGINSEGLKRRGFTPETITAIRRAHRTLYRSGLTLEQARDALLAADGLEGDAAQAVRGIGQFLAGVTRGIVR